MSSADMIDSQHTHDINEEKLIYIFRDKLPSTMASNSNFSFWHFLNQCIGKELSKIPMPLIFNEPISFLQRLSEYMEYSHLINEAAEESDIIKRMEKVSAFAVSVVSSNWERIGKPFNPLLGETYELQTQNFKWISEQVSHHPPISSFYAESPLFKFYGSIHPKLKFWGKSVEITPKGNITLELLKCGEVYTWQNVMCTVHNVIMGKVWIEHSGPMRIVNHSGNVVSEINFHSVGWFGKNVHRVEGDVFYSHHKSKQIERKLYGKWNEALFSVDPQIWRENTPYNKRNSLVNGSKGPLREKGNNDLEDFDDSLSTVNDPCDLKIPSQIMLWKVNSKPLFQNEYYNFTYFSMGLNQMNEFMKDIVAPTDSRFRQDIRCLEEGKINEASEAKTYLEEKQRMNIAPVKGHRSKSPLKSSESSPDIVACTAINKGPVWFVERANAHTGKVEWLFNGGYWKRDWSVCPELYK